MMNKHNMMGIILMEIHTRYDAVCLRISFNINADFAPAQRTVFLPLHDYLCW